MRGPVYISVCVDISVGPGSEPPLYLRGHNASRRKGVPACIHQIIAQRAGGHRPERRVAANGFGRRHKKPRPHAGRKAGRTAGRTSGTGNNEPLRRYAGDGGTAGRTLIALRRTKAGPARLNKLRPPSKTLSRRVTSDPRSGRTASRSSAETRTRRGPAATGRRSPPQPPGRLGRAAGVGGGFGSVPSQREPAD